MIKASEYREKIDSVSADAYREFEQKVDRAITTSMVGGGSPIRVACYAVGLRVRDLLANNYRAQGWKVEEHHDHRDGDYMEFTP